MAKKKGYEQYLDYAKGLPITKLVRSSFEMVLASWGLVALAALIDFIFLVLFSLATTFLQMRTFDHLYQLLLIVGQQTGGVLKDIQDPFASGIMALSSNPDFAFHMKQVMYHLFLMFVTLLILWCIFEGIAWWLSHKIRRMHVRQKEQPFREYIGAFIVNSAVFFIITLGLISWAITRYIEAGLNIGGFFNQDWILGIYLAVLIVIWYFGFITYSLRIPNHLSRIWQSIVRGVKQVKVMLPTLLFFVVFYAVLLKLWTLLLGLTNNYVSFAFGLVIFLPSITFARVLFIQTTERLR